MSELVNKYIPLHVHSDYSTGDSTLGVNEYIAWAKENEIPAIALTDHGNLCGLFQFNQGCIASGVKPILGIEAYCKFKSEFYSEDTEIKRKRDHLVILAKNRVGYKNLLKLLGKAMRENFYYRAIIFYEDLIENSEGLIISTACAGGRTSRFINEGKFKEAEDFIMMLKSTFKDDFYLEMMEVQMEEQRVTNRWIRDNHKRLGIDVIITTDTHYFKKGHDKIQDVLKLSFRKASRLDSNWQEMVFTSRNLWLKTRDEIIGEFKDTGFEEDYINECLDNTLKIFDKVEEINLKSDKVFMPRFAENSFKILCDKCKEEIVKRGLNKKTYIERMKYELGIIKQKNMEDYFLIVADICEFAARNEIMVGIGRGSGAGSLVVYLLGITKIDPLRYNLYFERFLNPQRKDPPDIDLDFDSRGRQAVEDYMKEKYGANSVSHIISFGRFGVKGAIRDVFRVFYRTKYIDRIDSLTKDLDNDEKDIKEALQKIVTTQGSEASKFINEHLEQFKIAAQLVGKNRHYSLHAGGVVIVQGDLEDYIPIIRIKDNIVSGFQEGADNRFVSESGLMKFDILGLNACSIINDALKNINGKVTLNQIINDCDNDKVLEQFRIGNTFGCFQFEGKRITDFVKKVSPKKFSDLVAINALYRPAVIQDGGLLRYLKNKMSFDNNTTDKFEQILSDTYGIPCYQEQIMDTFHRLGGLSLEEADDARHILKLLFKGKEDHTDFDILMEKFRKGCHQNTDYSDEKIDEIMETIKKFSQYSFNKAHATAYAMMGYAMMYLKVFYPHEYFSALLSNTDNADSFQDGIKINPLRNYVVEIHRRTNIEIVSPDVNISEDSIFKVVDNQLYFPFNKIKGVGEKSATEIMAKRPYETFADFVEKIDLRKCNKRVIKALIYSGALSFDDTLDGYEKKYKEKIDSKSVMSMFDSTSIIFHKNFIKLFENYSLKLSLLRDKDFTDVKVCGIIYKIRKIVFGKSKNVKNFISLYDGSDVLESCMILTSDLQKVNEGDIIKCKLTSLPSRSRNYPGLEYHMSDVEKTS